MYFKQNFIGKKTYFNYTEKNIFFQVDHQKTKWKEHFVYETMKKSLSSILTAMVFVMEISRMAHHFIWILWSKSLWQKRWFRRYVIVEPSLILFCTRIVASLTSKWAIIYKHSLFVLFRWRVHFAQLIRSGNFTKFCFGFVCFVITK